jgi:hypothetical protein
VSETLLDREPEKRKVERELNYFRAWFSLLTFLLTAVAFVIGFPALEDAGKKIGLGQLAFGLPFAIDLGMVTLLLWSMWNRGTLKRWWPPLIPAGLLLGLSSWLQYIHAVELISPETPELARWGLLILASALPLLLSSTELSVTRKCYWSSRKPMMNSGVSRWSKEEQAPSWTLS